MEFFKILMTLCWSANESVVVLIGREALPIEHKAGSRRFSIIHPKAKEKKYYNKN